MDLFFNEIWDTTQGTDALPVTGLEVRSNINSLPGRPDGQQTASVVVKARAGLAPVRSSARRACGRDCDAGEWLGDSQGATWLPSNTV